MESRNEQSKSNKKIMHFVLLTSTNFLLHYSSRRMNKDDRNLQKKLSAEKWKRE